MGSDRKFTLEALEPRLLLSVNGILDQPAGPIPIDALAAEQVFDTAGTTRAGATADFSYAPEASVPDLLAPSPQTAGPPAAPGDSDPAQGVDCDLTAEAQVFGQQQPAASQGTVVGDTSHALASIEPEQLTKADELVEALHASAPPPLAALTYLSYTAPDGGSDLTLRVETSGSRTLGLFDTRSGSLLESCLLEEVDGVMIIGSDHGDDLLTVDFSDPFWLPAGISYDGGVGCFDSFSFDGNPAVTVSYSPMGSDGARMLLSEGARSSAISLAGLEPTYISESPGVFLTSDYGSGVDELIIDVNPGGAGVPGNFNTFNNRISGTINGVSFESVTFYNIADMTIDSGFNDTLINRDDRITISSAGLVAADLQSLTIKTGTGADQLVIQGNAFGLPVTGGGLSLDDPDGLTVTSVGDLSISSPLLVKGIVQVQAQGSAVFMSVDADDSTVFLASAGAGIRFDGGLGNLGASFTRVELAAAGDIVLNAPAIVMGQLSLSSTAHDIHASAIMSEGLLVSTARDVVMGALSVENDIDLHASGKIDLNGTVLTISDGGITVASGEFDNTGAVIVSTGSVDIAAAGSVVIGASIAVPEKTLGIHAGTTLTLSAGSVLSTVGVGHGSHAGDMSLESAGNMLLQGDIQANGTDGVDPLINGGNGGAVTLTSHSGSITSGNVDCSGGAPGLGGVPGTGEVVRVDAAGELVQLPGTSIQCARLMFAINAARLSPIVAEAINRWSAFRPSGTDPRTLLEGVTFQIAALGDDLASTDAAARRVRLDPWGGQTGWFVDPTPADDLEFTLQPFGTALRASQGTDAMDRPDLLSVVMREMGVVLGLGASCELAVMAAPLEPGVRLIVTDNGPRTGDMIPIDLSDCTNATSFDKTQLAFEVMRGIEVVTVARSENPLRGDWTLTVIDPATVQTVNFGYVIFADRNDWDLPVDFATSGMLYLAPGVRDGLPGDDCASSPGFQGRIWIVYGTGESQTRVPLDVLSG